MERSTSRLPPSTRWTSFNGWDYNGMKARLENLIATLNKNALLRHAEHIRGQKFTMSKPFSAGQFWICFEMIAEDGDLVIARVRLPRHPDTLPTVSKEDELYAIACEVSTMRFVSQKLPAVVIPEVYAYEGPGSKLAGDAGAIYMLIEGFYGNTLQSVAPDLCSLPATTQEHIISQWTMAQAQLATLAYPQIGSICSIAESGEPVIGKLSTAPAEGLIPQGPFTTATGYFVALGEAGLLRTKSYGTNCGGSFSPITRLGPLVFLDIVQTTNLFHASRIRFPLNHMDLGMQNIIVDDNFNFLAVIDWEFAQTAPWQVNHYPMPFPLLWPDEKIRNALDDSTHIAHKNIRCQDRLRRLYSEKFRDAEAALKKEGRALEGTFAEVLNGTASRIYACFSRLGCSPEQDADYVREMVRLAYGFDSEAIDQYLKRMEHKLEAEPRASTCSSSTFISHNLYQFSEAVRDLGVMAFRDTKGNSCNGFSRTD